MSSQAPDTERTAVKTYVPAYQKAEWNRHAEEFDMSQSEFVRTMVQAGREAFGAESADFTAQSADSDGERSEAIEEPRGGPPSREKPLGSQVEEALSREGHLGWDELVAELTGNFEDRLEETLEELQRENRVGYSGRHDGYVLLEDDGQ